MTDKIVSARAQARTTRFSTFDVDSTLRAYTRAETIFRKNQRPEIRKQGPRHVLGAQRVLHPHEEVVKLFERITAEGSARAQVAPISSPFVR